MRKILWGLCLSLLLTTNIYAGIGFQFDKSSSSRQEEYMKLLAIETRLDVLAGYITVYKDHSGHMTILKLWEEDFKQYKNGKERSSEFDLELSDKIYQQVTIILKYLQTGRKTEALNVIDTVRNNLKIMKSKYRIGAYVYSGCIPVNN